MLYHIDSAVNYCYKAKTPPPGNFLRIGKCGLAELSTSRNDIASCSRLKHSQ